MEIKYDRLLNSISMWLGYQIAIGREEVIHEASLRYPLMDALTSCKIPIDVISLEVQHPNLTDKIVDILLYESDLKTKPKCLIELKLSKSSTGTNKGTEHQRIIDDLIRLAVFNKCNNNYLGLFIISGTYENFKTYFLGQKKEDPKTPITFDEQKKEWDSSKSIYKDYFKFAPYRNETNINSVAEYKFHRRNFGLKNFKQKYKKSTIKNSAFPIVPNNIIIRTTCMAITSYNAPNSTHLQPYACGIWKVEWVE